MSQQKEDLDRKKLLFHAEKPKRGVAFEIYIDETLVIKTKLTQPGIHIPIQVLQWIELEKATTEEQPKITADIHIEGYNQEYDFVKNQEITIEKETNGWYVKNPKTNKLLDEIFKRVGKRVICTIKGVQTTRTFFQAKELLEKVTIESNPIQMLISGGSRGTTFNIYKTKAGILQIECDCSMDCSGRIEMSDELGRYINGWWDMKELFVVGKFNNVQTVLRWWQRKKDKRIIKHIIIPYSGVRKQVKVVFSHPVFTLSDQAKQDLKLTKKLQQKGFAIKQLTTNWSVNSQHKDREFEQKVWQILKKAFLMQDISFYTEVKVSCAHPPAIVKCLDGMIVYEDFLGLFEIKTSTKIKNNILDEVIGELLHLQDQLQSKNIFSMLFINTEVTTTEQARIITKLYGIANNIILIGREEVEVLLSNPKLLLERLEIMQTEHQKKNTKELIIHPETLQVLPTKKLEGEAYAILEQLIQTPEKSFELIEQYCFLMNIPIADFHVLYNKNVKQNEGNTSIELAMKRRKTSSKAIIFEMKPLQNLHSDLIRNNSRTILEEKCKRKANVDYSVLLKNFTTLLTTLPPSCRVIGFKYLRREQGAVFERNTRNLLEDMGFEVISNVLFSYYGKHFEIDHLAFKDKTIQLISCKDRSSFRYLPNLYSKIIFAFGQLYLNQKTLYNAKGKLHIRVKKEFLFTLKKKFKAFKSPDHSLILTS